ncbi:MAG: NUDIX hydrolase [Acidimicrobiales bacterium]
MPGGFRRLSEEVVHTGPVISVTSGRYETPDGDTVEREAVRHPGAVVVVPLDGDEVVMIRQYRAPIDAEILEIPAGKRDVEGEPPEVTAARELAEEIGATAASLVPLCVFHNSPGFCDELSHLFLATGLTFGEADLQGAEERHMTIERVPLASVPNMIEEGEISDGKSIIGLLLTLGRV